MSSSAFDAQALRGKLDGRLSLAAGLPRQTLVQLLARDQRRTSFRFAGPTPSTSPAPLDAARAAESSSARPGRPPYIPAFFGLTLAQDGTVHASVVAQFVGDPLAFARAGLHVVPIAADVATVAGALDEVLALAADPGVIFVELDEALLPLLDTSVPEILPDDPTSPRSKGGAGVVMAVIDVDRLDIHHTDLIDEQGATRVRYLAEMRTRPPGDQVPATTVPAAYTAAELNADLRSQDPYSIVQLPPEVRTGEVLHGTHVTAIAAGNGRASKHVYVGVAPEADIIYVNIGAAGCTAAHGSITSMLSAVRLVFEQATGSPCVVNLSVGTTMGPRDGTSHAERTLDEMVRGRPGRAIVAAAGNSGKSAKITSGTVDDQGWLELPFHVPLGTKDAERIEVYCCDASDITVSLLGPVDHLAEIPTPGDEPPKLADATVLLTVTRRQNGVQEVECVLEPAESRAPYRAGCWRLRLETKIGPIGRYRASISANTDIKWLDGVGANDPRHYSITSPATAELVIAVGSYDHRGNGKVCDTSSRGPTADGRCKPDIIAPGAGIRSARARSSPATGGDADSYAYKSGTSMAAPHVAGLIARMLESDPSLDAEEIRHALIGAARKNGLASWGPAYGWGLARMPRRARTKRPLDDPRGTRFVVVTAPAEVRSGRPFDVCADVYGTRPGDFVTLTMQHPAEERIVEACRRGVAHASFRVTLDRRGPCAIRVSAGDAHGLVFDAAMASINVR